MDIEKRQKANLIMAVHFLGKNEPNDQTNDPKWSEMIEICFFKAL